MKANAPEKFYTDENGLFPMSKRHCDSDIEYIRTDAFIEKACEYFHRCLEDTKVIDDYRNILVPGVQARYTSVEEFIEEFINYMK